MMVNKMGIIGRKLGMTRIFSSDGAVVPVTLVQAGPCPIMQIKTLEKEGYSALQLAFLEAKEKHVTKAMKGHFAKSNAGSFRVMKELRVQDTSEYSVGDVITVERFAVGDFIRVTGISIGKGYQGVMRRWNFAGSKDSHGCEKVHRSGGSIGNNTYPGHVFKGKKMAGHWGAEQITVQNLAVVDVRVEYNLILIKGSIPGPKNGIVFIRKH